MSFKQVNYDIIKNCVDIPFNLYLNVEGSYILYATPEKFGSNGFRLQENALLYINNEDNVKYLQLVEDNIKNIMNNPLIPVKEKGRIIHEHSLDVISDMFKKTKTEFLSIDYMDKISDIIDNIFVFITNSVDVMSNLQKLISTSYLEYVHSLNTSVFAMSLLHHHSLVNNTMIPRRSVVKNIGICGILHDIGKNRFTFDHSKKRILTKDEQNQVYKHPIYGLEIAQFMKLDSSIYNGILFHHEKLDGSGYPTGTKNINEYAKVISICDTFSAMTSERLYRETKQYSHFESLKIIHNLALSNKFDMNYVKSFIQLISTNQFK